MSSSPLFPILQKPSLVGIARLAAEGETLREGHNVEYFTLPARSLLNPLHRRPHALYLDDQSLSRMRVRL